MAPNLNLTYQVRVALHLLGCEENPDRHVRPRELPIAVQDLSMLWPIGVELEHDAVRSLELRASTASQEGAQRLGRRAVTHEHRMAHALERMTRRHWPDGPDWTRTDAPPVPSWLGRDDLPGITKPRELRALLGRPPT